MPGGTAYYVAHGIHSINECLKADGKPSVPFRLITSVADDAIDAVEEMRAKGLDVAVIPSAETVFFENRYGADSNQRTQAVLAKAEPFHWDDLKTRIVPSDRRDDMYFILGSLLADDFAVDVVRELHQRGIVALDAQGFLREVIGKDVVACLWQNMNDYFKHIDILKLNEEEALVLTGIADTKKAALQIHAMGIPEVLLTLGSEGSIIVNDDAMYEVAAVPVSNAVDATGCGDTFLMAYVCQRAQGADATSAAAFAAWCSAEKLKGHGPLDVSTLPVT